MIANQQTILEDPHHDRGDLTMVRMAIRKRWPVKGSLRAKVIEVAKAMLDDDDPRNRTAAIKTIVMMEAQNQADEHKREPDKVEHMGDVVVKLEFDRGG